MGALTPEIQAVIESAGYVVLGEVDGKIIVGDKIPPLPLLTKDDILAAIIEFKPNEKRRKYRGRH